MGKEGISSHGFHREDKAKVGLEGSVKARRKIWEGGGETSQAEGAPCDKRVPGIAVIH
jgi:hypothetical protein